jgi:hypothetical protein
MFTHLIAESCAYVSATRSRLATYESSVKRREELNAYRVDRGTVAILMMLLFVRNLDQFIAIRPESYSRLD